MYYRVMFQQRRILSDGWHDPYSFHVFSYHDPPTDEEIWVQRSPKYQRLLSVRRATNKPYTATAEGWAYHLAQVAKESK